jgi:hypothetical protein
LIPNGEKAARILADRMRQIKRRFRLTVEDLIDERFFRATEQEPQWRRLTADNLSDRISAAYDIRSRYVHTGISFGDWVYPQMGHRVSDKGHKPGWMEIHLGKPILEDKRLADLLGAAPTYVGLERVIRYCLIRFAERNQLFVDGPEKVAKQDFFTIDPRAGL